MADATRSATRRGPNSPITIGAHQVNPGERQDVSLPVARLYTATSLEMPVKVLCGRRAGPVLFVSAAIHGDELNGVEIIRRLFRRKALSGLRGTLLAELFTILMPILAVIFGLVIYWILAAIGV